jgi:hypothetical protein
MGDVYSFPAGPPVAVPQFPGGARAPCTDPACGATLSVGAPRARARDADVEARSPLAGSRIPDRSAPGGARVRCADPADPSCGGTLTLHAPRVAARERRGDTFSFVAGARPRPRPAASSARGPVALTAARCRRRRAQDAASGRKMAPSARRSSRRGAVGLCRCRPRSGARRRAAPRSRRAAPRSTSAVLGRRRSAFLRTLRSRACTAALRGRSTTRCCRTAGASSSPGTRTRICAGGTCAHGATRPCTAGRFCAVYRARSALRCAALPPGLRPAQRRRRCPVWRRWPTARLGA